MRQGFRLGCQVSPADDSIIDERDTVESRIAATSKVIIDDENSRDLRCPAECKKSPDSTSS
jgi:hypothetical protein